MSQTSQIQIYDSPERYGTVSRLFHWANAYLVIWQMLTVLVWDVFDEGVLTNILPKIGPDHGTTGFLVAALMVPRTIWLVINYGRRPEREKGYTGLIAKAVHINLYIVILLVSVLPLIRAYGEGEGLDILGIQVLPVMGARMSWLSKPADMLHAPLAYVLGGLIGIHVAANFIHVLILRDGIMARMAGRFTVH